MKDAKPAAKKIPRNAAVLGMLLTKRSVKMRHRSDRRPNDARRVRSEME